MSLLQISQAVTAYKNRNGKTSAATRVKQGMIQLVSVTYQKGSAESKVEEISGWMPVADFCGWIAAQ